MCNLDHVRRFSVTLSRQIWFLDSKVSKKTASARTPPKPTGSTLATASRWLSHPRSAKDVSEAPLLERDWGLNKVWLGAAPRVALTSYLPDYVIIWWPLRPKRVCGGWLRKIAFTNAKGGVAKTTACVNIGAGLALAGYRTLLIDCDTQGHVSKSLGIQAGEGLAELVQGDAGLGD